MVSVSGGVARWSTWALLVGLAGAGAGASGCGDQAVGTPDAGVVIPIPTGVPTDEPYPPNASSVSWFREVTAESGIDARHTLEAAELDNRLQGGGVALGDVDGDGKQDLVFALGTAGARVFVRTGALRFVDATAASGLDTDPASSVALVDLDGDGVLDLLLGRDDLRGNPAGVETVRLYRGAGDGTFVDATISAGLSSRSNVKSLGVFDVDADGLLDVYVANFALSPGDLDGRGDELYRNRGDGTFDEIGARLGIDQRGFTWVVASFDADGDGDTDVFAGNDSFIEDDGTRPIEPANPRWGVETQDLLLERRGVGTGGYPLFEDVSEAAGVTELRATMGALVGDFDGDGAPDLYLSDFGRNELLLRRGAIYEEDAVARGLDATARDDSECPPASEAVACLMISWGAVFQDFDLDGYPDLLVVHGHILVPEGRQPVAVWRGQQGGALVPVQTQLPWMDARSLLAADLDLDGDLDLVVVTWNGPVRVFENTIRTSASGGPGYLNVVLVAATSPSDGLGSHIRVEAAGRTYRRQLGVGGMAFASRPARANVGLGTAQTAQVAVTWPSGIEQSIQASPDETVVFFEPPLLELSTRVAPADGIGEVTVLVMPRGTEGSLLGTGHSVAVESSLGTWAGPVSDLGDGSYRRTLVAPPGPGLAVIQVSVDGTAIPLSPRVEFQ